MTPLPKEIMDKITADAERYYETENYGHNLREHIISAHESAGIAAALHYSQIIEQKDKEILFQNDIVVIQAEQIEQLKAENERQATRSLILMEALEELRKRYEKSEWIVENIDKAIASYNNNKP